MRDLDSLPVADDLKDLPKVELHIHLSGSISIELMMKLSGLSREEVIKKTVANEKINMFDFVNKLDFPNSLMQTKENLYLISCDLVERLAKENVVYAEVRLTPMLHMEKGLTYDDVIETVLEGLNSNPKVKVNLILCMMRGATTYMNAETLKYTIKYLNKGVCALDISGDDGLYPLRDYMKFFELAALEHVPYTIHAGGSNINDLYDALVLHTKRIGNGVKAVMDIDLLRIIYYKKILLELAPSNDVVLGQYEDIGMHPINFFLRNNFNICVNSNNSTVVNVDLNDEYEKLSKTFNFTIDDFKKMNLNAINSSFLSEKEKEVYRKYFE